jgi:hypothetical protein
VSHAFWKIALMIGNLVISEVDALTYVVVSEAENCVPYGELVGTRGCLTLYPRCHTNRGRYNQVQLYVFLSLCHNTLSLASSLSDLQSLWKCKGVRQSYDCGHITVKP